MSKNLQSILLTTLMSGKLILAGQNWEERKRNMSKLLQSEYRIVLVEKLPNLYPLRLLKADWKKQTNFKYSACKKSFTSWKMFIVSLIPVLLSEQWKIKWFE